MMAFLVIIGLVWGVLCYWKIASKAGYSGWWSFLMVVPLIGIILAWLFPFLEWPSLKKAAASAPGQLEPLREDSGGLSSEFARHKGSANEIGAASKAAFLSDGTETEDDLYKQIWGEVQSGEVDQAVWARAFARCDGDDRKTKAEYINIRVARLKELSQCQNQDSSVEETTKATKKALPSEGAQVNSSPATICVGDICPLPQLDSVMEAEVKERVSTEIDNDIFDRSIYYSFWKKTDSHSSAKEKYIQHKVAEALEENAQRRDLVATVQEALDYYSTASRFGKGDFQAYWLSSEKEPELKSLGASLEFQNMCRAVRLGDLLEFAKLLQVNAGIIFARNTDHKTALWLAVEEQKLSFVNFLVACGADVNQMSPEGRSLIAFAESRTSKEIVSRLLSSRDWCTRN